jgi:vacuolar-type H+-ATPase subunit C/Vma6
MHIVDLPVLDNPSDFAYAASSLAILEKDLLSQSQFDQLRAADGFKDFLRLLQDTGYASYVEDSQDIKAMVEEEAMKTRQELFNILPPEILPFFDIFFRKYDYNNLKILLKSRYMNVPAPTGELTRLGVIPVEELVNLFEEGSLEDLPFSVDFDELDSMMRRGKDLQIIDSLLDRAYYRELLASAQELGDSFFLDFVRQQADLKNIIIFIRCRKTRVSLPGFLLDGGYIDPDVFEKFSGEGTEALATSPVFADYRQVISQGIAVLEKTGSYSDLETLVRNYLILLLRESRHYIFTIRPFIGYLLGKEHEQALLKKYYVYVKNHLEFGGERDIAYV